jgi:peptide subunit release factor 1 (eRF1)
VALREGIQQVIIAGSQDDMQELLRARPANSPLTTIGLLRLNPTSLTPEMAFVVAAARRQERRVLEEATLVREMKEAEGSGWGVNGASETLAALNQGRLRTLLVPEGQDCGGYLYQSTGELVLGPADCPEGGPEPVTHLVSWVIAMALEQRVEIEPIHDPVAARAIDGLAGLLRFR